MFVAPAAARASYLDGLRAAARARPRAASARATATRSTTPTRSSTSTSRTGSSASAQLLAALAAGARSEDELLDAAWADAPAALRSAAAVTLRAHLDKLRDEGRLPEGVEIGG